MAVTVMNDMVNPQVMADMINAKIEAQLKFIPYAKVNTDLVGRPGDTLTIPKWGYIGDAVNVSENSQLDFTEMSTTEETFTIGKAGKGVSITTEALNSGYGDPLGQAESQLVKAIYGKVNSDILNAALNAASKYDGTAGIIGYKGIVSAVGRFMDEEDGIDKVMFIHPEQETQLLQESDFISADKFEAGVAVNGAIGKIAGCWIKKSLKVPKVDAVTAVQGIYTVTIGGTVASGDKITVAGVDVTLDGTSGASVTAAAAAVKNAFSSNATYTATSAAGVVTLTEKSGKEGSGTPAASITSTAGTVAVATTTAGVAASVARYDNVIIKMEPDSEETEYSEAELPALTILLKKDTTVSAIYDNEYDRWNIAAYRYYGVALTNDAKVVVAKFAQTAAN